MFVYICFVLFMLYVVTDFGITKCFKFVLKGVKPKILFFYEAPFYSLHPSPVCLFLYKRNEIGCSLSSSFESDIKKADLLVQLFKLQKSQTLGHLIISE